LADQGQDGHQQAYREPPGPGQSERHDLNAIAPRGGAVKR
jgi:hypothetical protein